MPTNKRPTWSQAGRQLREMAPEHYTHMLELVQRMAAACVDPLGASLPPGVGAPIDIAPRDRSHDRALRRRAKFRVIDGGDSQARPRRIGGAR